MKENPKDGYTLIEMLIYIVITVAALNLICVTYNKTVSVLKFISLRCDDLQGLDLMLRDIKRDITSASGAEITAADATFTISGEKKAVYNFADGKLTRNGAPYYPGLETFTIAQREPDLVQIDIRLKQRGRKAGTLVSTLIYMRNIHEAAR